MRPIGMARVAFAVLGLGLFVLGGTLSVATFRQPPAEAPGPVDPAEGTEAVGFGVVDLEHGISALRSLRAGRVVAIPVRDGQSVKAGDPLLLLSDREAKLQLDEAVSLGNAAQLWYDKLRTSVSAVALGRRILGLNPAGAGAGAGAGGQDAAEAEARTALGLAEAELVAARAHVALARVAVEECRLSAPGDGMVLRVLAGVGEVVGDATSPRPLVEFAPDEPRIIRAQIGQEFASRLAEGQAARVRDDTQTPEVWSGTVTHVADWYAPRRPITEEPELLSDVRTVECLIRLNTKAPPLRLGQRVRVAIHTHSSRP
jgi:multidrug efflux pump subunit AcrA (membrane-fusion protein)